MRHFELLRPYLVAIQMTWQEQDLQQLRLDGLPSSKLSRSVTDKPLTQLLADCGMVKAGREVKDALGRNSVFINGIAKGAEDNMKTNDIFSVENALYKRFFWCD